MQYLPKRVFLFILLCFFYFEGITQNFLDEVFILEKTYPEKMIVTAHRIDEKDTLTGEKIIYYSWEGDVDSSVRKYENRINEKIFFTRNSSSYIQNTLLYSSKTGDIKTIRRTRYENGLVDYTRNIDPVQQDSATINFIRDTYKNISKIETYVNKQKVKTDCIYNNYEGDQIKDISSLIRQLESEHIRPENVQGAYLSLVGVSEKISGEKCSSWDTVNIWMANDTLFKEESKSTRLKYIFKTYQKSPIKYFSMEIYMNGELIGSSSELVKKDTLFDIAKTYKAGKLYQISTHIHTKDTEVTIIEDPSNEKDIMQDLVRYEYEYDPKGNWVIRYKYENDRLTEKIEREITYFNKK